MSVSVFEHPWLSGLFGDPEMAAILAPERQIAHMLAFEAAWSRACGKAGVFDADKAETAAHAIESAEIAFPDLALGTGQDGVPIPSLVKQLRGIAPPEAFHKGTTSQDVVDTALALTLREASNLIDGRINELVTAFVKLDARHGDSPLMGRTRMQAATEIRVRDRLLTWRMPLESHLVRLEQLRPRTERIQIGGASGDRKELGDQADTVVVDVATRLGLEPTQKSWHAMREGISEYAAFLSLVTGTLGKFGQDVALMAQQGIDEIILSQAGASSAMPHKRNPVSAEMLVALARFNAVQLSAMHLALVHEQERSGAAWTLEWMVLPHMLMATGRALTGGLNLCNAITFLGKP